MAINKPTIAGEPTVERRRVQVQPLDPQAGNPYEPFSTVNSMGSFVTINPSPPEIEGQLYLHTFSNEGNRFAQLYVGVDVDGTLVWKIAGRYETINGYTGKPIDPIYDFF